MTMANRWLKIRTSRALTRGEAPLLSLIRPQGAPFLWPDLVRFSAVL